ncbi:hypothetical protein Mal64_22150 [Pseudobythopirellula maris]|uniref:Uncharacterized protein n=1 Tax=Pseudobythopirellula maris TaxID=2527991 RepID=A0A5C5ZPB9_9BACT|nr:hypothetical protein [Pseudobythopirellula maris]TWT88727.1 hypothetical protein Mal64_22150 [Pseudobythopirellula maris]
MKFKYHKYREMMLAAIVASLRRVQPEIEKIPFPPNPLIKDRPISGIAVYLMPGDRFGLYFRSWEEMHEIKYSLGDWEHQFFFAEGEVPEIDVAQEYCASLLEHLDEDEEASQAVVNLAYIATAEALLDPVVTQELTSLSIEARGCFGGIAPEGVERMVFNEYGDVSGVFNYCEHVSLNRYLKSAMRRSSWWRL